MLSKLTCTTSSFLSLDILLVGIDWGGWFNFFVSKSASYLQDCSSK